VILSRTAFKRLRFRCCSDRHLVTLFNSVGEGVIETGVTEAAAEAAVLEGGEDPLMMVSAIWFRDQPAAHLGNHHGGDHHLLVSRSRTDRGMFLKNQIRITDN
jgi:hypothetical protein